MSSQFEQALMQASPEVLQALLQLTEGGIQNPQPAGTLQWGGAQVPSPELTFGAWQREQPITSPRAGQPASPAFPPVGTPAPLTPQQQLQQLLQAQTPPNLLQPSGLQEVCSCYCAIVYCVN